MNRRKDADRSTSATSMWMSALALGLLSSAGPAAAQTSGLRAQEAATVLEVTARDHDAAKSVIERGIHTIRVLADSREGAILPERSRAIGQGPLRKFR
jgi:hypothetical protein